MRQAVRDFSKEAFNSVVHSMFFTEIKWEKNAHYVTSCIYIANILRHSL